MSGLYIIMPVKDAVQSAGESIDAILRSGFGVCVYNDFSTSENTALLERWSAEKGFDLINLSDLTSTPSPNYRLILQHAQQEALRRDAHLLIVESDVTVGTDTFAKMLAAAGGEEKTGLVAAVTTDDQGNVNFPYLYAKRMKKGVIETRKRLSFCCTLLSREFLQAYSFSNLDPTKNWYDVFISHQSSKMGFRNLLLTDTPVIHRPHQSRPWKALKYTNPLKYYWQKLTKHRDKI